MKDTEELNTDIVAILGIKGLTRGDRQAFLDELIGPPLSFSSEYETENLVLAGAKRVIAVSRIAVSENAVRRPKARKSWWPTVEIYDMPNGLVAFPLRNVEATSLQRADQTFVKVARHVEILGPSNLLHVPEHPLHRSLSFTTLLWTEAPLRVYIDTTRQALRTGDMTGDGVVKR